MNEKKGPKNWIEAVGLLTTDPRFANIESPVLLAFANEVSKIPFPNQQERTVLITSQGVSFGPNCWYSHERITGLTAAQLNGNEPGRTLTGLNYMKWVSGETD